MSKIKLFLILLLFFGSYKTYKTIINFEKGAKNKIIEIQDKAGVERQANVIALLIFKGGQVKLIERFPIIFWHLVLIFFKISSLGISKYILIVESYQFLIGRTTGVTVYRC